MPTSGSQRTKAAGGGRRPSLLEEAAKRLRRGEGLLVLAALTGVAAGVAAVLLHGASHEISRYAFGGSIGSAATIRIIAAPVLGNLAVAAILRVLAPGTLRNGVAEVILALAKRGGRIAPRAGALALLCPAISMGTGGSVGPEGPIVQVGAAAGSGLGRIIGLPPHVLRTLAGCGAAAGIAGIFNAPIAGVLFAGEVVMGQFALGTLMPAVVAAAVSAAVARYFVGGAPAFEAPHYGVFSPYGVVVHLALGIAGGLVSAYFIRSSITAERLFARLRTRWPLKAVLGGAFLAGLGFVMPEVLGDGYATISAAVRSRIADSHAAAFLVGIALVKVVATVVTIASGGTGGVFAPCLVVGATLGSAIGIAGRAIFGNVIAPPGAFALVGMATLVGGGMRSPVGGMMIVFEMTGDYSLILPLMIASVVSTFVARRLEPGSLYTAKLRQLGEQFRPPVDREILTQIEVREVLEPTTMVTLSAPLREIAAALRVTRTPAIGVTDSDGKFVGIIRPVDLQPALENEAVLGDIVAAADLVGPETYIAGLDEDLAIVYDELALSAAGAVPVVDGRGRFAGIVRQSKLMQRYRQVLLEPREG